MKTTCIVDFLVLFINAIVLMYLTSSALVTFAYTAGICAYGVWCFYDGTTRGVLICKAKTP